MFNTYSTVGAANVALRNATTARPLSHETITGSSTTVKHLTVPTGAKYAIIVFEAADLSAWTNDMVIARYWFDNKTAVPTAVIGIPAPNMTVVELNNTSQLNTFSFILTEALAATIHVQYFK